MRADVSRHRGGRQAQKQSQTFSEIPLLHVNIIISYAANLPLEWFRVKDKKGVPF
jgi:hypothetical protein